MALRAENGVSERSTGTGTRLGIAAVVTLNLALAMGVAGGVTWLAARPGLRLRVDLTAAGENTLDAGCMASPAPVGSTLIVRTKALLYRIQ